MVNRAQADDLAAKGANCPRLLADVRDYLAKLCDETWRRRDAGMSEQAIAADVRAVMIQRHPDWAQPEWVERGVGCLYCEHAA